MNNLLRASWKASKRIWANIKGAWSLMERIWKGLSKKSLPGTIVKFRDWEDCLHVPNYNLLGVLRSGWGQTGKHSPICKQIKQQRVETAQTSTYRSTGTEKVAYSWNGILFSLQKKRSPASCNNIDQEDIMLTEISQSQKDKYCTMHLSELPKTGKFIENRTIVTKG